MAWPRASPRSFSHSIPTPKEKSSGSSGAESEASDSDIEKEATHAEEGSDEAEQLTSSGSDSDNDRGEQFFRVHKYRADIDGLRAFAVIPVMLYHFKLSFPGGFAGVDVFFVILVTSSRKSC
jgi:hypothetical protein